MRNAARVRTKRIGCSELFKLQHFTESPPRYSDATPIKILKHGIGRPSTYAPTLATIQERDYVEKNDRRYFKPTEIGFLVNDMLVENFPRLLILISLRILKSSLMISRRARSSGCPSSRILFAV